MTTPTSPTTGTDIALSPRQERLQTVRDDLAPGAKPQAIIPRNFLEAQQMCSALASSTLVPKAFRGSTGHLDMLIVVMTGSELGIPPMAALRLFTTWDGVPRLMAEGIRAVLLMSPDIEYFEMSTCDEKHATWIGKRRGRPEKSITWTMERAKRAGLTEKPVWRAYQESMLNARASMELGRILAPDIIAGMRSLEEAQDGDFIDVQATEKRPEFTAPPPVAAAPQGPPPGVPAAESPKRGRPPKDKPIEVAATERPTSAGGASGSAAVTSSGSAPPSTGSGLAVDSSPPSKLESAIETARAADAARTATDQWGQPIAVDPTAPNPSAQPAATSSASVPAASSQISQTTAPSAGADDGGFGEDPVDTAPAGSTPLLGPSGGDWRKEFVADLAAGADRRQVEEKGKVWMAWARKRREAGDATFGQGGENSGWMAKTYATRKTEVPA